MVDEVHDKALDVGAILILIGHDHHLTVPKTLCVCVNLKGNVNSQPSMAFPLDVVDRHNVCVCELNPSAMDELGIH